MSKVGLDVVCSKYRQCLCWELTSPISVGVANEVMFIERLHSVFFDSLLSVFDNYYMFVLYQSFQKLFVTYS